MADQCAKCGRFLGDAERCRGHAVMYEFAPGQKELDHTKWHHSECCPEESADES
jgi:hypothetical protein